MKHKKTTFIFLFFSLAITAYCQKYDNVWFMGYGCCSTNFTGIDWNFHSVPLLISAINRHFNFGLTNGQMCDGNGNLLFASNGIYICNRNIDTMMNGSGLNPSDYTSGHLQYGLHIPQANLFLPAPGDSTRYYLIHETSDDRFNTYATYYLYYSIVDMNLDNGLGGIIQKNTIFFADSTVGGQMTSVKHANGRDWWIIKHGFRNSLSYRFLLTPEGMQGPWTDDLITTRLNYFGQAIFSQDGTKYAYYDTNADLDIWDFDRCTGIFSNQIHVDINDSMGAAGAAFSRSGHFLYLASVNFIYQFDMQATDIGASKQTVAVFDSTLSGHFYPQFYQMQLGGDNRIYISSPSSVLDFGMIAFPDSAGIACDVRQHSVHLPGLSVSLPNHVNYYLGPVTGSACDSLINGISDHESILTAFNLFPNPVKNDLYLTVANEKIVRLSLYDQLGREWPVSKDQNVKDILHLNTEALPPGFYYLEIKTIQSVVVRRFVKN